MPPYEDPASRPPPAGDPADAPTGSDAPTRAGSAGSTSVTPGPLEPTVLGPQIEGYALEEEVHRGGQGVVYRAVQLGTKRVVALKVMLEGPLASQTTRRRFEREIELAASLRHPNIVTILDSGLSRGRYYFAMEYIAGIRLDRYVAQRRPPLPEILRLFETICDAVNFAHQRGVIHRDLKPPNILVDEAGQPHVLDFGLAKPVQPLGTGDSTVPMLSTSGQLIGTVAYMSPEQAAGHLDVDVRSDVYSLGVIFYEALVGQPPYSVEGALGDVLQRITLHDPVHPRSRSVRGGTGVRIDDELSTILLKALEKEPQRRYQTAGDLGRDFRHLAAGEPIEAKRASGLYMLRKTLRRYRLQTAMAGFVLVMLLGFLVALTVLLARERDARRQADLKTIEAGLAVDRQQQALEEARQRTAEAMEAQRQLRHALVRQHIQRGDLALAREDLRLARDSYWEAVQVAPTPAALWALRRYYLQTPDTAAERLALGGPRLSRLAPGGDVAAVCHTPTAIAVRHLGEEGGLHWVPAPGRVERLSILDDGTLAAAGEDWVRSWSPGALVPAAAGHFPAPGAPEAVFPLEGGRAVLIVDRERVLLLRSTRGQVVASVELEGRTSGTPDYASTLQQLAIPTTRGVELVRLLPDDRLITEMAWTGDAPARAVRFDGDVLAVLADSLYTANITEPRRQWIRTGVTATSDWSRFDLKSPLGIVAYTTAVGEVGIFRNDELLEHWRYLFDSTYGQWLTPQLQQALTDESLGTWQSGATRMDAIVVSLQDQSLHTLDDQSIVTEWTPPNRKQQRRLILDASPTTWAAAADGSAIVMALPRGRVVVYEPGPTFDERRRPPRVQTILRPRLFGLGGELSVAISADGQRTAIRDRSTLRLVSLADRQTWALTWADAEFPYLTSLTLGADGELLALLTGNQTGDRQRVVFQPWQAGGADIAAEGPAPLEFIGAVVRDIAFVPRTRQLLAFRSNGQLFMLTPAPGTEVQDVNTSQPWMQLDSPAERVVFNRTGDYLAVACEDRVIRVISVPAKEVRHRIPVDQAVTTLAFNPRDDVLLVRLRDGSLRLHDPATGERLTSWTAPTENPRALGVWSGTQDALLLEEDGAVYEYRYAAADAVIERNRAFGHEQQIARLLRDNDYDAAWHVARELEARSPRRAQAARLVLLETRLATAGREVPNDWPLDVLRAAPPALSVRLGHAAYAGQRFAVARELLTTAARDLDGAVDALTRLRIAQCDYLAEDYVAAAAGLEQALLQPDLSPREVPAAQLQQVAALLLADELAAARRIALKIGERDPFGRTLDVVGVTYASVIARVITGIERESAAATILDSLLGSVGEHRLALQDDEHFFAGELARQRNDPGAAADHYQRCIDLARDNWPSDWARFRLHQIRPALSTPGAESE